MRYFLVLSILIVAIHAKVINFSPLPMDKAPQLYAQYNVMLKYLEQQTGYKFNFIYSTSYKELLRNFEEGKIDIIELGALPYVKLKEQFKEAYPFLTFNSKYGKPYYSCDLITTEKDINKFSDIVHTNEVILTRSLSTCGYLMSEYIMKQNGETLKNFNYQYVGTHSNVLLKILLDENTIGTVKSTVLDKYSQFKFKTLAKSPNIPGFAFVANKNTIGSKEIKNIEDAILKLNPLDNEKDKDLVSKWSVNTKYGAVKTDEKAYDIVIKSIQTIEIPKEKR
jgi:phosphonate transport system substrate-binding protein